MSDSAVVVKDIEGKTLTWALQRRQSRADFLGPGQLVAVGRHLYRLADLAPPVQHTSNADWASNSPGPPGLILRNDGEILRRSSALSPAAKGGHLEPPMAPPKVRGFLERLTGIESVHDLHIWPMSTTETALTAHLLMPSGHPGGPFMAEAAHELHHDFGIGHTTLQIEIRGDACALAPDNVV